METGCFLSISCYLFFNFCDLLHRVRKVKLVLVAPLDTKVPKVLLALRDSLDLRVLLDLMDLMEQMATQEKLEAMAILSVSSLNLVQ